MQFDFPALGTHWWVEIWDETRGLTDDEIKDFVVRFCSDFEARFSRFQPSSLISQLNRDREVTTDPELRAILTYGITLYRRTRGMFNILTGHILEARGYDGAYSFIDKGSAGLAAGNPLTDLCITNDTIKVHVGNVDLGGFGKGWLIDSVTELLRDRFGLEQFLINGGGDIYATHQSNQPIEIYLEDPLEPGAIVGSTRLKNRAFAASSPHKRAWPIKGAAGAEQHHIVSLQNDRGPASVKDVIYLTAPTATDADAFATTLLQVEDTIARDLAEQNSLTIL